jgi:hypothetical protein
MISSLQSLTVSLSGTSMVDIQIVVTDEDQRDYF